MIASNQTLIVLIVTTILNVLLMIYISKGKNKTQLQKIFMYTVGILSFWLIGLIMQITLSERLNIQPIYFDYIIYIAICKYIIFF